MNNEQKDLVKATVPILKEHGLTLTKYFYKRMFTHNPELKNVFNMGNQEIDKQQKALAMAVLAYAEHIDDPSVLLGALGNIGQKHTSLSVRKEHYIIVGHHLINSIGEVLGEAATEDILSAWKEAYTELASIMSGAEQAVYESQVTKPGGWTGWRPFVVKKKVIESSEITSFYFYPVDGGGIADYIPGQFISIRLFIPELNLFQPRQYSLSSAPTGEFYRISVKKEKHPIRPEGIISNRLHNNIDQGDIVDLSAPAGSFILSSTDESPIVFISGGVGQTPLISMAEHLIARGSARKITWIHGCRNRDVHAFRNQVEEWATSLTNFERHHFYQTVTGEDDNISNGIVDLEKLSNDLFDNITTYYICGPAAVHRNSLQCATFKRCSGSAYPFRRVWSSYAKLEIENAVI